VSTSISIIGASGAVGSTLAGQLLRSGLLKSADCLQLVGHGLPCSSAHLLSSRIDLMDAFDDEGVDIEVVADLQDADGDIVVICAGLTLQGGVTDRRDLGRANLALFEQIAETCSVHIPDSLFIIVSNPVELAVKVFSEKLGRDRVLGMGAEQDSLRFARAIAHDLGISRHFVAASVLGEHGQAMVPLWGSVRLDTTNPEVLEEFGQMVTRCAEAPLQERVFLLRAKVLELLGSDQVGEAYEISRQALPDARIFVQPIITGHTMHSTPNSTSNATLKLIAAALSDSPTSLHGQVLLSGDFLGIEGTCGVPLFVSRQGWNLGAEDTLSLKERERVREAAESIAQYLSGVLSK
jgi:malate dehydrogenase